MAPRVKQRRPISRRIPQRRATWLPRTELRRPIPVISSSRRRLSRTLRLRWCNRPLRIRPTPTASLTPTTSKRITASRCFRPNSPHRHCRNIRSLRSPATAIYGRPDIGATLLRATSGYPVPGRCPLKWASCGRLDIGDSQSASIASTTAFGAHMSATTAALTMDSAMAASAIRAGTGPEIVSAITVRSTI